MSDKFHPLFIDKSLENQFQEDGFVKTGKIDVQAIQELKQLIDSLDFDENTKFGTNVMLDSPDFKVRHQMKQEVRKIIDPFINEIVLDRTVISASFLNKLPIETSFLSPHQDWTYHNPNEANSIMGWIPLVDVTEKNGALGVIKGSHKLFNYVNAYPFPMAYSPVYKNNIRLFSYLKMIDMKAGEILFFNNQMIHGSFPNYTENTRYALNFCLSANSKQLICYIMNPKTNGKTVFKYNTDEDFTTRYNNNFLSKQFRNGKIDIDYELVSEEPYKFEDNSWSTLQRQLHTLGADEQYHKLEQVKKVFPSYNVDNPLKKPSFIQSIFKKFSLK